MSRLASGVFVRSAVRLWWPPTTRALLLDITLALMPLVVQVVGILGGQPLPSDLVARTIVTAALLMFIVPLRRRYPITSLLVAVVIATVHPPALLMLVPFAYGAGYRVIRSTYALAGLVAASVLGILLNALVWSFTLAGGPIVALMAVSWFVGRYRQQQRAVVVGGWQRADQLESERLLAAEQARREEQLRIARDMHDSLGHDLSLASLRASALELDDSLDEVHRRQAGELRSAMTDAMERLQDVIGLLRDETALTSAMSIEDLIVRVAEAGVQIDLRREPVGMEIPAAIAPVVYRVVQESVTNAVKHAPDSPVVVLLATAGDRTEVRIRNTTMSHGGGSGHGGHGIPGLTERVRLVGGTLRVARTDTEFVVHATLPHSVENPASTDTSTLGEVDSHQERAVSRFRRLFWTSLVGPSALVLAATLAITLANNYFRINASSMPIDRYSSIRIGMTESELRPLLPVQEDGSAALYAAPSRTPGTRCEYYAFRTSLFTTERYFRLCFTNGILSTKDTFSS